MKEYIVSFLWIAGCCLSHQASAQIDNYVDERKLQIRVKQIDEFMMRFNGINEINPQKQSTAIERTRYLRNLFNTDSFRDASTGDLNILGKMFIDKIVKNGNQIHFEDSTWWAEVTCDISLQNIPQTLTFILVTERIQPYEYKWVIKDIHGKAIENVVTKTKNNVFISPAEHETGFIGLIELTKTNAKDSSCLYPEEYQANKLSVFNTLIYYGLLKIIQPQKVKYYFRTVPGYEFTVERFEKLRSYNTGWLISSLRKIE